MRELATALALAVVVNVEARAEGKPQIEFDKTVYDFGVTALVESVTGTFTFQNVGDGVLKLQKPKPSCGCTVANVNPETLQPGEKGELVFTIKLGTAGVALAKEIYVPSNDPQNPSVRLGIEVETKTTFQAQPPSVSLGEMRLGATSNETLIIKRLDGKKLKITKVEPTSNLISAKVEPLENGDGQAVRLNVEVKADGLPRHFSEQIRLYTDDSIGAGLTVFVSARLLGDIRLEPEALAWGMPAPGAWQEEDADVELSRSLFVSAMQADRPLLVRNVSSTLKQLRVKLRTLEKKQKYEIVATLPKRLTESIHGTISFETNLPSLPKVEVPVEINVWKE